MTMRESTLTQAGENKLPTNKPLNEPDEISILSIYLYRYISNVEIHYTFVFSY